MEAFREKRFFGLAFRAARPLVPGRLSTGHGGVDWLMSLKDLEMFFFQGKKKKKCFRTTLEPTEIAEIPLGLITTTLEMQVANVLVMHSLVSCHCQSLQKGLILFWRTLAHPELQRWAVTVGIAL